MAEELRTVLTIIGILLIGGIFGHGLWSIRKNKEQLQDYKQPGRNDPDIDVKRLDEHGVGKPRSVAGDAPKTQRSEPSIGNQSIQPSVADTPAQVEPTIDMSQTQDQVIESDDHELEKESLVAPKVEDKPKVEETEVVEPSEVLIIHVCMPDNQTIAGASLLPRLISMGFKFGEMDIFHRHENTAGTGPILFSLASMYNPGTFDIDNMEQISTKGLSLFMTLPCSGEALANFNMMHNAAKKVSEQFGAQLLDSNRSAMTVQTVRHYVEKIREFERKQLING
jgi:cell division protein ZipA